MEAADQLLQFHICNRKLGYNHIQSLLIMFETILKVVIFLAAMASLLAVTLYQDFTLFILVIVVGCFYIIFMPQLTSFLSANVLYNKPLQVPTKDLYNEKRFKTYPSPVTNTWYHFCDSDELKNGQVMEYRALDRVFVLWRDNNGKPVCQDAFCIHQGANLGHGGKVIDNCLQCPFHNWKFSSDGTIIEIPYLKTSKSCDNIKKKQKTYHCMDYCGWLLVYFHVENKNPEFYPPTFISNQLKTDNWKSHIKYDVGYYHFSPIDIVDQAGDHAHFHTLHSEFMFPWTKISFPEWLRYIFPIAISHTCNTYRGDDKEWIEEVKKMNFGTVDPYLLVFTDLAGLTWKGRLLRSTLSQTVETYIGPALIVFHIPFTLGMVMMYSLCIYVCMHRVCLYSVYCIV